jgi:small nuclear ribonucleoprotein (snRNP)-like protein
VITRRGLRALHAATVIVHTRDDRSIRGVLTGVHRDCAVVQSPEYLAEDGSVTPLEGRAVVRWDNVAWFQELSP